MADKIYTDLYGNKISTSCIGCMEKGENVSIGYRTIWSNELFRVHQDFAIPIPGLIVIETVRHVQSTLDFTEEELVLYNGLRLKIRKALHEVLGEYAKNISTILEEDSSHWHEWYLPYYPWMREKVGGVRTENILDIFQYAKKNMSNEETFNEIVRVNNAIGNILNRDNN